MKLHLALMFSTFVFTLGTPAIARRWGITAKHAAMALATLTITAPPAAAADLVCEARAKGSAGEVVVRLTLRDGQIREGHQQWMPPADKTSLAGASVAIYRPFANAEAGRLGPVAAISALMVIPDDRLVAGRGLIGISSNKSPPIFKESGVYARAVAAKKEGKSPQIPTGSKPVALMTIIPFDRADPATVPLLDSLDGAQSVITSLTDERGAAILDGRGLFWIGDHTGSVKLSKEAHEKAVEASTSAADRCKAPPAQ